MKIKLFGGEHDGRVLELPRHQIQVHMMTAPPRSEWDIRGPQEYAAEIVSIPHTTVTYVKQKISGWQQIYYVWSPSDWSIDRTIEELLRRAGAACHEDMD